MNNPQFVTLMENTEKEAKRFFERHPSLTTPQALIEQAERDSIFQRENIDEDLFKHLMKKYHHVGY